MFLSVLRAFTRNNNTGNMYEIATALDLLRKMGLTDAVLDTHAEFIAEICNKNIKVSAKIVGLFTAIRLQPVGTGLIFNGRNIVDIVNVTQDDGVGRTGDLVLRTDSGASLSLSVCEGAVKKRTGAIEKCLSNPTARRFGCSDADMEHFKTIQARAVEAYKTELAAKYGTDEASWPSRVATKTAIAACSEAAAYCAERFALLDDAARCTIVEDLLRIDGGAMPADYLSLVNGVTMKPTYFRFEAPKYATSTAPSVHVEVVSESVPAPVCIDTVVAPDSVSVPVCIDTMVVPAAIWAPTIVADGIYLRIKHGEHIIGSTQVKFNNGVYHRGKTSSICSSWNATFNLRDMFTMSPVKAI